jgi:hypothetical protein
MILSTILYLNINKYKQLSNYNRYILEDLPVILITNRLIMLSNIKFNKIIIIIMIVKTCNIIMI